MFMRTTHATKPAGGASVDGRANEMLQTVDTVAHVMIQVRRQGRLGADAGEIGMGGLMMDVRLFGCRSRFARNIY